MPVNPFLLKCQVARFSNSVRLLNRCNCSGQPLAAAGNGGVGRSGRQLWTRKQPPVQWWLFPLSVSNVRSSIPEYSANCNFCPHGGCVCSCVPNRYEFFPKACGWHGKVRPWGRGTGGMVRGRDRGFRSGSDRRIPRCGVNTPPFLLIPLLAPFALVVTCAILRRTLLTKRG